MAIKRSIKKEIRSLAIVSVVAALLITFVINSFYTIAKERKEAFAEFNTLAEITALNSQSALMFNDKKVSLETLNALSPSEEILDASILTAEGEVLASKSFDENGANQTFISEIGEVMAKVLGSLFDIKHTIKIYQPVKFNNKLLGSINLSIDSSLIWKDILLSIATSIGAMLVAIVIIILHIRKMTTHIMLPISRLNESARNIAITHEYSSRVNKVVDNELGTLTDQFNLMLDEIEKRDHELAKQTTFLETEVQNRTVSLKNSVEEMRSLLNSMAEGAYGIDSKGICTFVNTSFLKILGYDNTEQVVGKIIHNLIQHSYEDGRTYPMVDGKIYDAFLHNHSINASDEVFWRKDGTAIPVEYWSQPIIIDDALQGSIVTFIDISERNAAEKNLRIAATAFESQEGMMVTDAKGTILRTNKAFTEITGFTTEDAIGKTPHILQSGLQDANFYTAMWERLKHSGNWDGEVWNKRKDGQIYPERLVISAVKDTSGTVTNYVASLTDITLKKTAEVEIQNLAFYDTLTKLPNRRLLQDRLKQALASSSRTGKYGALMFLDLDHFKTLNDTLGHDIGDLLLKQVAERLIESVRAGDTVSRLGGDEFVVLLEDLSEHTMEAAEQTEVICEKIIAVINKPYQLDIHEYQTTSSIGVSLFSNHGETPESILKHADIAMYHSKKLGRNQICFFDPHMQDAINTRVHLERELRKALDEQRFELYYQVQVNDSGQATGAEALIRWIHPDRGMISPFHFIPLAEESGLILSIGQWVLETACAQIQTWQANELTKHLILSVNVSASQFRQSDFVVQVQSIIAKYAINPMLLKMELTESMLLENIEGIIATINALKTIGIRFSLDDFGTGYSSLQYLKKLPLFQLKIDQSFVRDIATDSSDRALVLTIITMAKSLDLSVIAEGVETEEQRQFLIENNCTNFQGYLFGKPVPIDEFEALLGKS